MQDPKTRKILNQIRARGLTVAWNRGSTRGTTDDRAGPTHEPWEPVTLLRTTHGTPMRTCAQPIIGCLMGSHCAKYLLIGFLPIL